MSQLILKKDGVITSQCLIYDYELKKEVYEEVYFDNDELILSALNYSVVLENGFSLRDYFKLIKNYDYLLLLDDDFDIYMDGFDQSPKIGCCNQGFNQLLFLKIFSVDVTKPNSKVMSFGYELVGKNSKNNEVIDISYVPLSDMLDIPIFISGMYEEYSQLDDQSYVEEPSVSGSITFFDFIKSIMDELSACGTPEDRIYTKSILGDKYLQPI